MDPSLLFSLPKELLIYVVSNICGPHDLARLCLTCKTLQDVAMPRLYYRVTLDLDNPTKRANRALLPIDHPGHKHIRSLIFKSGDAGWEHESSCRLLVRRILQVLPRDTLQEIVIAGRLPLDQETILMLFTQQRALRSLDMGQLRPKEHGADADVRRAITAALHHLETLSIARHAGSNRELEFYAAIIVASPKLQTLAFDTDISHAYVSCLDHVEQIRPGPWKLKRLRLNHQACSPTRGIVADITFAAVKAPVRSLIEKVSFRNLTELVLSKCFGVEWLLDTLAEDFCQNGACLKKFSLELDGIVREMDREMESAEAFLQSFAGLQTLAVRTSYVARDHEFDMRCLRSHHASLVNLYLAIGADEEYGGKWVMSVDCATELFTKAQCLEQVALTMPEIQVDVTDIDLRSDYHGILTSLARQPRLRVLRVISWPGIGANLPSYWDMKQLDSFATKVLKIYRSVRESDSQALQLLCFGDCCSDYPKESAMSKIMDISGEICYVPGVQRTVFGTEDLVAIQTESKDIRWMMPDLEDFQLAKQFAAA